MTREDVAETPCGAGHAKGLSPRWRLRGAAAILGAVAFMVAVALPLDAGAPEQTVGLFLNDPASYDGYTLFSPLTGPGAYLIDNDGLLVHEWDTGASGYAPYLLDDGSIIRTGGNVTRRIDWDGAYLWNYEHPSGRSHHDIEVLPNGNVLMIVDEVIPEVEAIANGRDPANLDSGRLEPVLISEVEPTGPTTGDIVWEWRSWNHLVQDFDPVQANYGVVEDHPELIDINYIDPDRPPGDADWHHANGVDYNPEFDQIIISLRHMSEFWIIDHSTTTSEAAGHTGGNSGKGGDLLYRWGNPAAYGAADQTEQQLSFQHDAQWIDPGLPGEDNILVFNNGNHFGFSSVFELEPPVDEFGDYALTHGEAYAPAAPAWSYVAQPQSSFFSVFISGAQRQPNDNTLIDSGAQGTVFEVQPDGTIVWLYVSPVTSSGPVTQGDPFGGNFVFRAYRYAPDYPGLAGRDLTPGDPIELYEFDSDLDGCEDEVEIDTNPGSEYYGGLRDPSDFWDFYDVWTYNSALPGWDRDRSVTLADILSVAVRFGSGPILSEEDALAAALVEPVDQTGYHPAFDRGPITGAHQWNRAPADGSITLGDDILGVALQFGHTCF